MERENKVKRRILIFAVAVAVLLLLITVVWIRWRNQESRRSAGEELSTELKMDDYSNSTTATTTAERTTAATTTTTTTASDAVATTTAITTAANTSTANTTQATAEATNKPTTQATTQATTQGASTQVQVTEAATSQHIHSYEANISYVYHPEEGHYEEQCVVEGYEEEVYEYYDTYCYYCGTVMDGWGYKELLNHSAIHGAYGTYKEVVDTIWHEPVYEQVWVVDKEEYYEEVITESCTICGYVK